jgi:hypothetical protein
MSETTDPYYHRVIHAACPVTTTDPHTVKHTACGIPITADVITSPPANAYPSCPDCIIETHLHRCETQGL